MADTLHNIDIERFKSLFPTIPGDSVGNDILVADVKYINDLRVFEYPFRFDGYILIYCISGNMKMDINLNSFQVSSNTIVINTPGNILKVSEVNMSNREQMHFIVVAISRDFMTSVRIDFKRLFNDSIALLDSPCIKLNGRERRLCKKYLEISTELLSSHISNKKEALSSIISSVSYVLGSIWSNKISEAERKPHTPSVKSKFVFDQFLRLVTEFHTSQRNMAFYAERLGLTPKYLSKVIKMVSSRSAPDWIDSFVILEAKNLLRYSELSIKEIVAKLNFPNQSVFYKFFKSHTDLTPSQYRNA